MRPTRAQTTKQQNKQPNQGPDTMLHIVGSDIQPPIHTKPASTVCHARKSHTVACCCKLQSVCREQGVVPHTSAEVKAAAFIFSLSALP
jgi:hypothetical protein